MHTIHLQNPPPPHRSLVLFPNIQQKPIGALPLQQSKTPILEPQRSSADSCVFYSHLFPFSRIACYQEELKHLVDSRDAELM